jgi:16S rRNA (adenine1518-N6/adenine1519-N6)-dimethyltransferase
MYEKMKQVRPKKHLGQHFLVDLNIARRIADTVDTPFPELPVLEVGPGMGVMTQYLLEKPRPVKVVEIDRESVAYLREHFPAFSRNEEGGTRKEDSLSPAFERIEERGERREESSGAVEEEKSKAEERLIEGDFLRLDLSEVFGGQPFVLTGNYPYDISSQIFFHMLDYRDIIPCCTGMIQHEVALRLAAKPGNKQYGVLSVLMQAWYDVEYLFTVEPDVFNPPPKVRSAVIRMTRNATKDLGCDPQLFRRVVKAVFNQRRKMLRVSLRQLLPSLNPSISQSLNIELTRRPEQLSVQEFVQLTNAVAAAL